MPNCGVAGAGAGPALPGVPLIKENTFYKRTPSIREHLLPENTFKLWRVQGLDQLFLGFLFLLAIPTIQVPLNPKPKP